MNAESLARHVFDQLGFETERIPPDHVSDQADLIVRDSDEAYIVEVKEKSDAEAVFCDYHATLDRGSVFVRSTPTGYTNSVSNVLDKAAKQLAGSAASNREFRVAWLELSGLDQNLQFRQTLATIYGIVQLLPLVSPPVAKDCYYFRHNVAHRRRDMDAFLLSDGEGLLLATNEFSPRYSAFAATRLHNVFASQGGVVDPVALDQTGAIYVADCSIPRRDTQAVLDYVRKKYRVARFLVLEPVQTSAWVRVDQARGDDVT